MWFRSWFDALKSRFLRTLNRHERRASGQGLAARRLKVETLEDRSLLAFAPITPYPAGDYPQAIVSADFNGGGLDLAVMNRGSSNVSVLLGDGSGGFGPKTDYGTGAYPRSLAVGDVTGDGDIDLITANDGGDVSILRGDGAGSFAPPDSIALPYVRRSHWSGDEPQSPYSVATGDFNGDGNLDLAVTGVIEWSAYVNALLSDGSGGFHPTVTTPLYSRYPYSIAVGQFDADANDDLAITQSADGYVSVHLSNGSGGFSSSALYETGYYHDSVAAGDVNGDNLSDLVTADFYGNTVSVLLGTGLGTFGPASNYAAGTQPKSVAMADFNGDTHIDLVTANSDAGTVSVLLGYGDGSFKQPVTAAVGSNPLGVVVGDFDGVGGPDAASANSGSGNVSVLLNDGIWPLLDAPSIFVNYASVAEGHTGTTAMEFTVTLSAASDEIVTVHYATADYSTVAGDDYVAAEGTLTFLPTVTSMTIPVDVIGDRVGENGEYFYLQLSEPTNAFLARATGLGEIIDDEPRVSIDYDSVFFAEGNIGTTNAIFRVRLSAPYDLPVSVDLSAVEGDTGIWYGSGPYGGYYYHPATLNTDFEGKSQSLTFNPGELVTQDFTVLIKGDRDVEADEYFFVNLNSTDYGTIVSPQAVVIIVNDEPYTSISSSGSVVEGNTGTTALTFTISLSAAPDATNAPVTVNYATADGSATADGGDYQAKTDTVSFGIGETSKQITVTILDDKLGEYDEHLYVNLTGANGAVLDPYTYPTEGLGYIQDNEPRLSINSVSITEGNSGTTLLTFTVTLSAAYDQPVTVNYATQDIYHSATAGSDYLAKFGSLTFNPGGLLTQTITVTIKGDKLKENYEHFYVILSGASSNALISNMYGLGTILNDDGVKGPRR